MIWLLLGAAAVCVLVGIGLALVLAVRWAGSTVWTPADPVETVAHGLLEDHSIGIFSDLGSDPDHAEGRASSVDRRS